MDSEQQELLGRLAKVVTKDTVRKRSKVGSALVGTPRLSFGETAKKRPPLRFARGTTPPPSLATEAPFADLVVDYLVDNSDD